VVGQVRDHVKKIWGVSTIPHIVIPQNLLCTTYPTFVQEVFTGHFLEISGKAEEKEKKPGVFGTDWKP
jgi:hypothetical protein